MTAAVALRPCGSDVECVPLARLGSAWAAYQAAVKVAGARNVKGPDGWRTLAPLARARDVEDALRHAGFEVRSEVVLAAPEPVLPTLDEVEAASGVRLFDFQRAGAEFLRSRAQVLLLDEMGLGKTYQVLAALPEGARCLVVCPASLKAVWQREAARVRPELDVAVLVGRGSFRWPEPGQLVVTNYDVLPQMHEHEPPPDGVVVVADEAHALKSYKAARTQRFRALAEAARLRGGRTWLLTGTPLTNRPPDLWGVLQAAGLAHHAFGSWEKFCAVFGGAKTQVARNVWAYVWGKPDAERVAGCLRAVSLCRHKADVLTELPPKRREVLAETELRARDAKALTKVLREIDAAGIGTDEDGRRARAKLPHFEGMSEARRLLAAAKLPLLTSIVEEHEAAADPLVVFSAHVAPMRELGAREGWRSITGETPVAQRAEVVAAFQSGSLKGVACTIAAAGVGLTLTRAWRVVFLDRDWTPSLNDQAEDRLHRIGQSQAVLVTDLVVDHPLERRIRELCLWKESVVAASVGASATWRPEEAGSRVRAEKKPRRGPAGAVEEWAARALRLLTDLDPDRAREENACGWNRLDGAFGARLAAELPRGLTDGQWVAAVRTCRKYHRQVGRCPEEV